MKKQITVKDLRKGDVFFGTRREVITTPTSHEKYPSTVIFMVRDRAGYTHIHAWPDTMTIVIDAAKLPDDDGDTIIRGYN